MFDLDRWQEIWQTLSANKLRTILTAFGVSWGILMLMVMLGAGSGLQNGVKLMMGDFATNSTYIWAQRTSMAYEGLPQGRRYNFTNDDVTALRDQIPEIDLMAPRLQLGGYRGGNNVSRGTKTGAFQVNGDYPENQQIKMLDMVAGRFINQLDMDDRRKTVVIGPRTYQILFEPGEDPIGEDIHINGVYFKVVGMFKINGSGHSAEQDEQSIFIPFTTFQHAFNRPNTVEWFAITAKPDVPVSVVEEKAKKILAERHNIHPEDTRAFGSFNAEEMFGKITGLFIGIKALSWFVGFLTIIAGVIGVSNIMLVVVKERTKEIGIKRAIGASPFIIVSQIITESVVLTMLAGYAGLVAGVVLVEFGGKYLQGEFFANPQVDISLAINALIILIVSGALAGLIPASRAVNIKTVEALRN